MLQHYLVDSQLFHQVRVDTFTLRKPHDHHLHALLLQGVRYIIEQVLVWNTVQSLHMQAHSRWFCSDVIIITAAKVQKSAGGKWEWLHATGRVGAWVG